MGCGVWVPGQARDDSVVVAALPPSTPPHSRDAKRPGGSSRVSPKQGSRECRMRAAPAISCAMEQEDAHMSIQGSGEHPTSPAQWLYGLYVLSPENGSFASVAPWEIERLPGALTPAPRRRDHTTSPYASAPVIKAPPRPPQSHPTSVTTA